MSKIQIFRRLYVVFVVALLFPSLSLQAKFSANTDQSKKNGLIIDSVKTKIPIKKAPVVPFDVDTLFYVYGNLGASTAEQRAEFIEKNIRKLEKEVTFEADSIKIIVDESNLLITYQDLIIMGVTEQQAKSLGYPKEEIAQEYRGIIIDAIKAQRSNNIWIVLLKQIGLGLFILAATFFVIKYLLKLFRWFIGYIRDKKDKTIKILYFILDADKQISLLTIILKIIRVILLLIILYVCLTTFFGIFPQTKGISDTLLGYIINPMKKVWYSFVDFLPDLFSIIVIIVIFRIVFKVLKTIAEKVEDGSITFKGFYRDWAIPTYNITKVILFVLMLIFIFSHLPFSDNRAFQGVSVFLGVLFSLGSTSIISNIVSGLVITYMRPFKVGDRIKMGEHLGNVVEKTPLVTRIKTPKNELITIPNGSIMTAQTVNYSESAKEYGLILYSTVTMGYDVPWPKVHELLIEAGLKTPNVLHDPKPFVLQLALDDFYCSYQINVYTREANQMSNIYSDLNKNIQDIFNREGLELLSPHYRAQRDGSEIVIPKEQNKTGIFHTAPISVKVEKEDSKDK